jgi:branched-chain amino acid transport system permease protein
MMALLARNRASVAAISVVLAVLVVLPHGLASYGQYLLALWAVFAIAAIGLNLTLGYAGQISLAQAAFLGIGAYTSSLLTTNGYPYLLALPLAAVICFVLGLLLGFPALRVQHHYLAFVTLGFNQLVYLVLRNESWLTKGTLGVEDIKRPVIFGISTADSISFFYFSLIHLIVVSLAVWGLIRSPWGRAFRTIRENPTRAASLGIDVRGYTLLAFAIGSALGGVAGVIYAPLVEYVDPTPFILLTSLSMLLMVMVGGAGSFTGPYLGAAVVMLAPEWLRFSQDYYLLAFAVLVMVLMAFCPQGLVGLWDRLVKRLAGKAGT